MGAPHATRKRLLAFALKLPGAYLDHPWGEDVAKVNRKVFVFLGVGEDRSNLGMTVKLSGDSHHHSLSVPGAAPAGYGLGRSGWVTVPFRGRTPDIELLKDWIEESYRAVAPKRLVSELDCLLPPPRR